ncbi:MAG: ABC transporter substrate-binding protein, partial [Pygmaiobacter sp.]
AVSAQTSNPNLTFSELSDGFECSTDDTAIAIGLVKGSAYTEKINKVLAGISEEERNTMMDNAVAVQPLAG